MSKPRTLRLQFSLRALLVAMALVGVAIVVYRWPWTVVVETKELRTSTQYHRSWDRSPVKHGLQAEQPVRGETVHRWFHEGELRKEQRFQAGVLRFERNSRGGKLQGPWWAEADGRRVEGGYEQDLEHGTWIYTLDDEIREKRFHQGKLHGRREWRTRSGRVLQSAEYEQGRLVKWNDRELDAELHSWVEGNVSDEDQRKIILMPISDPADGRGQFAYFGAEVYRVGRSDFADDEPPSRYLTVQRQGSHRPKTSVWNEIEMGRPGVCLGAALLEDALENSQTFAHRFHTLHIVPITAASLDWEDRTGVNRIRFEPDSQQARAWLAPAHANAFSDVRPEDRFRQMFQPKSKTGITIDTTAIDEPFPPGEPMLGGGSLKGPFGEFPRRDLLGIHLDREGCYCDQVGNTLVIKRHK
jgi:hypothetical protein